MAHEFWCHPAPFNEANNSKIPLFYSPQHLNVGPYFTVVPSPQVQCSRRCPRIYQPVCDNQGRTHPSTCVFSIAQCQITTLKIVHNGPCTPPACTRPCPRLLRPVCDSMGETHLNECQFNKAKCLTPQLKMVHKGRCKVATTRPPTVKPRSSKQFVFLRAFKGMDIS